MDMLILILLSMFAGLVIYHLLYNPYIHLVVGSLMTDVQNMFKKITTWSRKK
jgi:hypothetical protein